MNASEQDREKFQIVQELSVKSLDKHDHLKMDMDLNELRPHLEKFLFGVQDLNLPSDIESVEVTLHIVGKAKIKTLNAQYRGKDSVTDVLSFPVHENLREGFSHPENHLNIGDIIVCLDKAKSQAKSFAIPVHSEIVHLFVHGFLHLCGYDHEISAEEEKIMFDLEDKLMKLIYPN